MLCPGRRHITLLPQNRPNPNYRDGGDIPANPAVDATGQAESIAMRILIVSDIHGNFDALAALQETYDELWVLGDLVNYGPDPAAVIDFVSSKAAVAVCGNHDYSIGYNQDPRCSARFREMAEATRGYTNSALSMKHKHFLRHLASLVQTVRDGTRFYICHAVPSDPLFGYCPAGSPRWLSEVEGLSADIVLVGHTHVPSVQTFGPRRVVNPGSLGQPKTGSPQARYAIWEDGKIELKSYSYPVEPAVAKVQALPIQDTLRDELSAILRTGEIPQEVDWKEDP
ncbi:MAG: metallophosphoesterase family protein [Terriglobia bacterium]